MTFEMTKLSDDGSEPTECIVQTRMWMVNTEWMCNTHLGEEHTSIHMFLRLLKDKKRIQGFIDQGFVEIHNLRSRHDELVEEMIRRGMEHKTSMPWYFEERRAGYISEEKSAQDLVMECNECRERRDILVECTEKLLNRDF
jgi:hypothetical protein